MGIIKPKRPLAPVPFLQTTIEEIAGAPDETSLAQALQRFDSPHHFERAEERNLLNWLKVLNRFDELLERYVSERDILASNTSSGFANHTIEPNHTADFVDTSKKPDPARLLPSASAARTSQGISGSDGSHVKSGRENVDVQLPAPTSKKDGKSDSSKLFSPSPSLVCLILRLTQRLIRNASHDTRHVYSSVDQIGALLADESSAIVLLALGILNMLLQRSQKLRSNRTHLTFELSERLLDLCIGWGGRENGLGLLECCSSKATDSLPAEGRKMYFEYSKGANRSPLEQTPGDSATHRDRGRVQENSTKRSLFPGLSPRSLSPVPIPLPLSSSFRNIPRSEEPTVVTKGAVSSMQLADVGTFPGQERWLLSDFAGRHGVPKAKLFSLLAAYRRAKRFAEGRDSRIELTLIRLYAITTLFQAQPISSSLHELLGKEPELLPDIVALARADRADGVQDIPRHLRVIAVRCMTAMSADKQRVAVIMSAAGVSVHHGALPTLLRTEINALLCESDVSDVMLDISKARENPSDLVSMECTKPSTGIGSNLRRDSRINSCNLTALAEVNRVPAVLQRIQTTEALISLVQSLANAPGSSGATSLANSGVLGILIPLLKDADVRHSRVVAQAIRAMQAIVEGSAQTLGCQLFRDHDGLTLVADRIALEVGVNDSELSTAEQNSIDERIEVEALRKRGETRGLYERLGRRQMTPAEALEHQPPSSSTTSRGLLSHSKWALLRALHQLLLTAVGSGGNEVRELVVNSNLPKALRKIMAQPFLYGGGLFQSAATVTTDIAHAEPTATPQLVKAGLAATVLRSIELGLPPCGEAVRCIPNLLAALCLAPSARDIIVSSRPLKLYLLRLATPFYSRALQGEIPVHIGSALDELMRHVEALRPDGNEAMIEYLRLSALFVNTETKNYGINTRAERARTTFSDSSRAKSDDKPGSADGNESAGNGENHVDKVSSDSVLLDKMKLAVANNSCRLAGFAQGSSEHQEGIVENGGLDHMINLRYAPALASPEASIRDGNVFARHYPSPGLTVVSLVTSLRNFSSRHGTSVLRSLFTVILRDAATVLKISGDLDDSWLPQEDETSAKGQQESTEDFSANVGLASRQSQQKRLGLGSLVDGMDAFPSKESVEYTKGKVGSERESQRNQAEVLESDTERDKNRTVLRTKLSEALCKLRVDVVLLSGLSRGGPGSSAGAWENAGGSEVAAIISTVERAARYHLALVYTGLTLSASSDGDLSTARVTAAADPTMKAVRTELAEELFGDIDKTLGRPLSKSPVFSEACKRYKVPPEGHEPVRQEVKGLAWCLVTFAVAAQRLYSTLSRGLTFSSRRLSRDPARYAVSAKSLAATIGRIFSLHLKAAESLWDKKVLTMGNNRVVAAWDYVRGILIEIKGTLFDESRRVTQSLILRSFLDAGGAEALALACRPFLIVQAAAPPRELGGTRENDRGALTAEEELDNVLKKKSLSVSSIVLAISEVLSQTVPDSPLTKRRHAQASDSLQEGEKEDTDMSTDSISNQARAISRIVVSEAESGTDNALQATSDLQDILGSQSKLKLLRDHAEVVSVAAFEHCENIAVRRIASDVWNTLCGFLHLLASCPGLLYSNSSPIPEPSGSTSEWEPRDVQRSALTVTLRMLVDVTRHPHELLSAIRPDGSAMTDLLCIMHTTSQVAEDLCQSRDTNGADADVPERSEPFPGQPDEADVAGPPSPDPDMLHSLVEMGFPERRATRALQQTAPGGIEYAMEWLLSNPEEEEESDSDDEEEERTWEEGDGDAEPREDVDAEADDPVDSGTGANVSADAGTDGNVESTPDLELDEDAIVDGSALTMTGDVTGGDSGAGVESNGDTVSRVDVSESQEPVENAAASPPEDNIESVAQSTSSAGTPTASADTPSAAAGTGEGIAEDVMVDTRAERRTETRDEETEPRTQRINSEGKLPEKRLGQRERDAKKKSADGSSSIPSVKVSIESEGSRLLDESVKTELSHLSSALEKAEIVSVPEISSLGAIAGVRMSETVSLKLEKSDKGESQAQLLITPVSVESFKKTRKELFESFVPVTQTAIKGSDGLAHGKNLPYIAIELLSILQKDGALLDGDSMEFAALLNDGLRTVIQQEEQMDARHGSSARSNTASLWSHYGGNRARRALQSCGTFDIAFESLAQGVADWEQSRKSPLVDEEATQPIKKLTIREHRDPVLSGKGKSLVVNNQAVKRLEDTGNHLKPVTHGQAAILKRLTTCLLLLDALIRYESKDRLVEHSKKVFASSETAKVKSKKAGEAKKERMDTDEDGSVEDAGEGSNVVPAGPLTVGETREAPNDLNEVMRDLVEAASSSAMEVDDAVPEAADLETMRQAVKRRKKKAVSTAKKLVGDWMSVKDAESSTLSFSRKSLLSHCLRLLDMWQNFEVGDALLAVLQLIASLTSDWNLAKSAIENGLVSLLLGLPHLGANHVRSTDHRVVRLLTKTIVRHLIEDPGTLEEAMCAEIRSLLSNGQSRTRPAFTLRTLITATSPMVARDMQCFISALTATVRVSDAELGSHVFLQDYKPVSTAEIAPILESRSNVTGVVSLLSSLIAEQDSGYGKQARLPVTQFSGSDRKRTRGPAIAKYALEMLSELIEFSQVAAVAFIRTPSPSSRISGSALDYVIQRILPQQSFNDASSSAVVLPSLNGELEELPAAARNLFLALCSKTANTHEEAIASLARATSLEAEKDEVSPAFIKGVAQCIAPTTKLRVLRVILHSGIANDLARSLKKLDLSVEKNFKVALSVLQALSLIGQTATYLARHGDGAADDVSFSNNGRDPWGSLRDRDDLVGHGSSFMVI